MKHSSLLLAATILVFCQSTAADNFHFRGNLTNSFAQFEHEKKGHVAFIGGSITEMNGYRPMVSAMLQKRFPETEFTFTNAGISSTCSTTGAFRLTADVLSKGPVDLLFIEFAVNDDQDAGHARRECIRGVEGIIRQCRRHNPNMDIVITYFVNPGMLKTVQAGKTPMRIEAHAAVARHYNISTINLAKEVADQIAAGKLTWGKFGGTHPAPHGNAICAGMIERLLQAAWRDPIVRNAEKKPHAVPEPLDKLSYENGRFILASEATFGGGWQFGTPAWNNLPGGKRARFTKIDMLCADKPDETTKLRFTGTAIGAYVVAGPDAGMVTAAIDGGEPMTIDLYHRFSRGLHYPRTVMFATDLKPGEHTLELKVANKTSSKSHAARIMQFVVN
jgi:lysophospholipase L1-like esterase